MKHAGLTDDIGARGILLREHIKGIFIKAKAHVVRSDFKDALRISGQVCQQVRVALTQKNRFITEK